MGHDPTIGCHDMQVDCGLHLKSQGSFLQSITLDRNLGQKATNNHEQGICLVLQLLN